MNTWDSLSRQVKDKSTGALKSTDTRPVRDVYAQGMMAPQYSALTFPVAAGAHCIYEGELYAAKQAIAASEAWTAAHWDKVQLGAELAKVGASVADLKSQISNLDSRVGTILEDSKNAYGSKTLLYDIHAGIHYRIRTGAGILGWLKTQTASSTDVDIIGQNVPANSDFEWVATGDAAKIYIYYNAESTFSIVEIDSISDEINTLELGLDSRFKDQSTFSRATTGYNFYDRVIIKDHTYAICNHGPGIIGSMQTATRNNARVEWITQTTTPVGGMVVFTATADAERFYVSYNEPSSVTIYDMASAFTGSELAAMTAAKNFSPIATYEVGDYCTYNFRLWKCVTAISTPENWTQSHWVIADAISAVVEIANDINLAERIVTPNYILDSVAANAYISEDMSIVGDEVWLFTHSASVGGQQDGYISMLNAQDYSVMVHQCTHNLGHCGTTDYDRDNDRMIISGADNGAAETPYTYIYHNVSAWKDESVVAYVDQTVDRIDLSALASQYGPVSYLAACWGPRTITGDKLVYLFGGNNWFLLLMGMGTTELDLGTYTAASSGRYNGTYKLLNYWKYDSHIPWEAYDTVMQGIKMHDGIVYTSNGHRAITVWEWIFKDDHVASVIQHRSPWIDNSGNHSTAQGQGLDFNDGQMIVAISNGYIATVQ